MDNVVDFIKNDLLKDKGDLLYLCKFGSHLYGTDTPNSDTDYKGIFLPKKEILLLGQKCNSITFKSGDNKEKNTKDDIDIQLWSLQYFFELLGKGETNAIDLIYSPTNKNVKNVVIYKKQDVETIFKTPLKYFDPSKNLGYVGYIYTQLKRWGLKGSRLGILKDVYKYLEKIEILDDKRLRDIKDDLIINFYNESYCFEKIINKEDAIVICGKVHLLSISLEEFYNRIKKEYEKYGWRAEEALQNKGIDWKCVMHSLRCLTQVKCLLNDGEIKYPLYNAEYLKNVKNGNYNWKDLEPTIVNKLKEMEELQSSPLHKGKRDEKFIKDLVLSFYEL